MKATSKAMWHDVYTFLRGAIADFDATGAIAPSSEALADAITDMVAKKEAPAKILEVGAGTGVFTRKLVQILQAEDCLDICESNTAFVKYLRAMTREQQEFIEFRGTMQIYPIKVEKIEGANKYDFIISSLPLNAFPPELVEKLLGVLWRLVKPQGWISYFEYIGIRHFKAFCSGKEERTRIDRVSQIISHFLTQYEVYHIPVWRNLPPACARHCQKK